MKLEIQKIGERKIIISGIGKLFYQKGLPISISIKKCMSNGYEVSLLHVADELLKHGWSSKTVFSKIREDLGDSGDSFDIESIRLFCFASYEDQREIIFKSLFKTKTEAYNVLKTKI